MAQNLPNRRVNRTETNINNMISNISSQVYLGCDIP